MQPWKENEQFFDKEVWTVMMMVARMYLLQLTSCKVFLNFNIQSLDVFQQYLSFILDDFNDIYFLKSCVDQSKRSMV